MKVNKSGDESGTVLEFVQFFFVQFAPRAIFLLDLLHRSFLGKTFASGTGHEMAALASLDDADCLDLVLAFYSARAGFALW